MKKMFFFLLATSLFIPKIVNAASTDMIPTLNEVNESSLASNAKSAILIEQQTGKILFEKNSHEKLAPASMTKIMSMLIIIEKIEKGIVKWDDLITISERASSMGGSQILLEVGEQMSVSDLFKGVAVASGNDAVVALAEAVSGTVEDFVIEMNKKLKELGLKDSNFKNPHGLDEADHYSSSYDMAFIARELLKHEKVIEFTSIYEDYLRKGTKREFWLTNTNKLVRFKAGVDGLKTGYTAGAGYCLTATMKKDDLRLISTVMGESTSTIRNTEISALLDYGYAKYKAQKLISKDDMYDQMLIDKAKVNSIKLYPNSDFSIILKKGEELGNITYEKKIDKIKLPIEANKKIGYIIIKDNDKEVGRVELISKEKIEKNNIVELFIKDLKGIISLDN